MTDQRPAFANPSAIRRDLGIALLLCTGLFGALTLHAAQRDTPAYAVRLDAKHCTVLRQDVAATFGPDWRELSPYAQRCAVAGPDGRTALTVDVVRIDRAYRDGFFTGRRDVPIPLPIVRDARGTRVGLLPDQFPENPPSRLRVTFTRWRGGWPTRIELYEQGESALAPHAEPPMVWNAQARMFQDSGEPHP